VKVLLTSETSYQPDPQLLPAPNDSLAVRRKKAKLRRDIAQAQLLKYSTLGSQLETTASDIPFISGVGPAACVNASNLLQSYARNSSDPLHMLVYSPGGSVVDGASLLDVIKEIKKTHTLTTTTLGCAASMAGHLSQAASEGQRRIGKNGRIMIHRIARVFSGGQSQNKDQKAMMEKLEDSVLPILIGRSDISREEYMERTAKSDWWLTAPEALRRKLVDEVF
jgi:ATP-dependent protease ClpP protease subunit